MVTGTQKNQMREFFGPSVDFSKVKIKESRFVSSNRPWACGNVIRVPKTKAGEAPAVDTGDLIHECGHVWQHQRGQLVFLSALTEQIRAGIIHKFDPYDFGGPSGVETLRRLSAFFTESQAQIIAEYWKSQHGYSQDRLQAPFSTDYVQNLRRLVEGAQIGVAVPGKATLLSRIDSAAVQMVNWALALFD